VGKTPEESQENALYWNNQSPWVRTRAYSQAPRWAQRDADEQLTLIDTWCSLCGKKGKVQTRYADVYACPACEANMQDKINEEDSNYCDSARKEN
jgi:hypothetical protein